MTDLYKAFICKVVLEIYALLLQFYRHSFLKEFKKKPNYFFFSISKHFNQTDTAHYFSRIAFELDNSKLYRSLCCIDFEQANA